MTHYEVKASYTYTNGDKTSKGSKTFNTISTNDKTEVVNLLKKYNKAVDGSMTAADLHTVESIDLD